MTTRRTPGLAAAAAVAAALALTGCSDGTSDEVQARQEALIHRVAQQAVELPGVACARGQLDAAGLPRAALGDLAVSLTFDDTLDREARLAVFEQVGRMVWEQELVVSRLVVAESSGLGLGDAIGAGSRSVQKADLERAFGPKPPLPSPPLPAVDDPGNPDC